MTDILADILIKQRSEVMRSILTYYDEKLHMKTVRQEGYEDGYDDASKARQAEVDALTAEIRDKDVALSAKDVEIADMTSTLDRITKEFEEYKKMHL